MYKGVFIMTFKQFIKAVAGYFIYRLVARKPEGKSVYLYDERGRFIKVIR